MGPQATGDGAQDGEGEGKRFDSVCPWCGREAEYVGVGVVYEYQCACGAVAFGAPAADFDEVIDEAINRFGISPDKASAKFAPPDSWLARSGVETAPGGEAPIATPLGPVFFHWFRRTGPPADR